MSYRVLHVVVRVILSGLLAFLMSVGALAQISPSSPSPSKQRTNDPDSEEAAVFERILNRVRFENDGTEVSETEAVVHIQSQAGVEEFGQLIFGYSSATEKLEV